MSKPRIVALAVVLLVVVAAGIWLLLRRGDDREYATATLGSIDVTIQTVGSIQATDAQQARAGAAGTVVQLGVAPGDVVEAGDILALLDREPFERAVADADRAVVDAEYALQLAQRRVEDPSPTLGQQADVLEASRRVQTAREQLAATQRNLTHAVILAPAAGTVIELLVGDGDVVGANQLIARLATPAALTLSADVDEIDLPNVRIGAEARFRLDAFPATEVTGAVTALSPTARQQGGATVFTATIRFEASDGLDIRPGMNADVTIVTDAREGVLLIPERALKTVGERSYVDVRTGDGAEEREVTLGYRGNGQVEVVAGLEAGEQVVLH